LAEKNGGGNQDQPYNTSNGQYLSKRKQLLDALRQKAETKKAQYTEQDYNAFGWVRANNVINAGQYKDFTTKFAEAINGSKAFVKTKQGEFMIPVSDIYNSSKEGINSTILFAKGKITKPIITRVLKIIGFDDETMLSLLREYIYENERNGIKTKATSLFLLYTKDNF